MAHLMRSAISTALIGTGYAVIMVGITVQLRHNIDTVLIGWVFGVLAMGTVVACDIYSSRNIWR